MSQLDTYVDTDVTGIKLIRAKGSKKVVGMVDPQTGIQTLFAAANFDVNGNLSALLNQDGSVALQIANQSASAKVLDAYLDSSQYEITGNTSGTVETSLTQNAAGSQVKITSASGATSSIRSAKETTDSFNPDELGVMVFSLDIAGKNSSKFLQIGSETISFADSTASNVTSPLYGRGIQYLAVHASEFPTFYADKTVRKFTPNIGFGLSGNDGITVAQPGRIWYNVQGSTAFVDTFDDINDTILTVALPYYEAVGRKMTIFVPTDDVGAANKLTWDQLASLESLGHAICTNSTTNDAGMSTTVSVALANANKGRQALIERGFNAFNANFVCYAGNEKQTATTDALKNAGFLLGRTTEGIPFFSGFGFGGQQMYIPSYSLQSTRTVQNIIDQYDLAIKRKCDQITHTHRIVASGATGSNINLAIWESSIARQNALISQGLATSMTFPEFYSANKDKSVANSI